MHHTKLAALLYGAVLIAPAALAQTAAGAHDPADAGAPAPPLIYSSAFDGYTAYQETAAGDWRAVNDEVARVGGHMGIFAPGGGAGPVADKPAAAEPGGHAGGHHAK